MSFQFEITSALTPRRESMKPLLDLPRRLAASDRLTNPAKSLEKTQAVVAPSLLGVRAGQTSSLFTAVTH
jgi:hypothetical protein